MTYTAQAQNLMRALPQNRVQRGAMNNYYQGQNDPEGHSYPMYQQDQIAPTLPLNREPSFPLTVNVGGNQYPAPSSIPGPYIPNPNGRMPLQPMRGRNPRDRANPQYTGRDIANMSPELRDQYISMIRSQLPQRPQFRGQYPNQPQRGMTQQEGLQRLSGRIRPQVRGNTPANYGSYNRNGVIIP